MDLPALVLTAGFGTRLDPLTRLIAKPAVPLAGRTLIERVLDWLAREGVQDAVLNLHYKPESITSLIGDGARVAVRVRYSREDPILGSAGGPRHALPLLAGDTLLIVNGDTLCDVALRPMLDAHRRARALVTMAVVPNPAPEHYNGIQADDAGRVAGFVAKGPAAAGSWHFVGIQFANRSVFEPLPDNVPAETIAGMYRDLLARQPGCLQIWPVKSRFLDVGTPADYSRAAQMIARESGSLVEPGAAIDASATVKDTIVWRGSRIPARASLTDCIVAGGPAIPPGFRAVRGILLPASFVRPGDRATVYEDLGVFRIES